MGLLDILVLCAYFAVIAVIGFLCMYLVDDQEGFYMGDRKVGKWLQTFAAFGAGTGNHEPILVTSTTWTSGLSGIWSVFLYLFVTPFYWIVAVWYRRMRHITIGDWFEERYESKGLGAAYAVFALMFYMVFISILFSAISKVTSTLIEVKKVTLPLMEEPVAMELLLIPVICFFVILYGLAGGLKAAYWSDLMQGVFIILLSIILVPVGLSALVEQFGDPSTMNVLDGMSILHDRLPESYFQMFGGPRSGEFPLHYIVSLTLLTLVGVVVYPHFIAVGGGSADSENTARFSLVTGNFIKRFCTIAWAFTGLIVLALLAGNVELVTDPDKAWGLATRELLGPLGLGLVGLMVGCLLAALMSSADTYMLVTSACIVRNIYAAYVDEEASEKEYLLLGRITGFFVIAGAGVIAMFFMDVFEQFKFSLEIPILFAAPFWVGIFWRRANRTSVWVTVLFSAILFFVIPMLAPFLFPDLRTSDYLTKTNGVRIRNIKRKATKVDVAQRAAWERAREQARQKENRKERKKALDALGDPPPDAEVGEMITESFQTGGKPVFWTGSVKPDEGTELEVVRKEEEGNAILIVKRYQGPVRCTGRLNVGFLLYEAVGMNLEKMSDAMLETLRIPLRVFLPFLVLIVVSFFTPMNSKETLDRYYAKMKTPVREDPEEDRQAIRASYENPEAFADRELLPEWDNLEIQKPRTSDLAGFVVSFVICFLLVGLAAWLAGVGV